MFKIAIPLVRKLKLYYKNNCPRWSKTKFASQKKNRNSKEKPEHGKKTFSAFPVTKTAPKLISRTTEPMRRAAQYCITLMHHSTHQISVKQKFKIKIKVAINFQKKSDFFLLIKTLRKISNSLKLSMR